MSVSPPATARGAWAGRRGLRAGVAVGALVGGLFGETLVSAAKNGGLPKSRASAKKDEKEGNAARALIEQGRAALLAKDHAAALAIFTAAYRQSPSPEVLFQLGSLAAAERRGVAARDLLRRYLQESAADADSPDQKEAQRLVEIEPGPCGEVNLLGARGALVFVDDRLVGALPLPLPLLVPLGTHKVTVELGAQRVEEQLKILSGQVAQMRVNQRTGVVVVSLPQAIILLPEGTGGGAVNKLLTQALKAAADKDHSAIVSRDQAVAQAPAIAGCLDTLPCQLDLVNQNETVYALRVRMSGGPGRGPWQLAMSLIDGGVSAVAATANPSCADCTAEQAVAAVAAAFGPLLQDAVNRRRGTIEVSSQPSGAEVYLAGEKVGTTPLHTSRLVGDYSVKVQKDGYESFQRTLTVADGQTAAINAVLPEISAFEPAPAALLTGAPVFRMERQPRPVWRVLTGLTLIGGGALVAGFGASALSVDKQCDLEAMPGACGARYSTLGPGALLVGAGALLVAGGITLVAIPGRRIRVQVAAAGGGQGHTGGQR